MCGGAEVAGVTVFGADYADVYDVLYRAKNYGGEVDLIERVLARHGLRGSEGICSILAADRKPRVAARPARAHGRRRRSLPACWRAPAPRRIAVAYLRWFHEGDICRLDLGPRFEAVLMMFTVLGYQFEDADWRPLLAAVRRHLEPGACSSLTSGTAARYSPIARANAASWSKTARLRLFAKLRLAA